MGFSTYCVIMPHGSHGRRGIAQMHMNVPLLGNGSYLPTVLYADVNTRAMMPAMVHALSRAYALS